jgi:NAD(P)-dependent dehydrogenase (short-subunit alcohol dehydrogenase family)
VDLELAGQRAIVTGGGSNIGRGIVRALAAEGCRLVILDIDDEAAASVAAAVADEFGVECQARPVDVTDRERVASVAHEVIDGWGGVDLLVHAAGGPLGNGRFFERSPDDQERDIRLNLFGALNVCWAVLPSMVAAGRGRVVLIASDTARQPALDLPAYSIAKAGVTALIRLLATEVGPSGVVVNGVNPMFTPPTDDEPVGSRSRWRTSATKDWTPEKRAATIAKIPLGRAGTPAEIGDAVAFLAGARAAFINGQILSVNGGGIV